MILSCNVVKILFHKVYLFARTIHCNCSIFEKLPKKDKGLPKIWSLQNRNPAGIFQDSLALSSWDSVSCVYSNIHKHQTSGQPKGLVVFWNEILGISSLKYVSKWKLLLETNSENKIFFRDRNFKDENNISSSCPNTWFLFRWTPNASSSALFYTCQSVTGWVAILNLHRFKACKLGFITFTTSQH